MEKQKKESKTILIVVVAILILMVIGVICYQKIASHETKEPINTTEETSENNAPLIDMTKTENVKIVDGEKENVSQALKKEKSFNNMTVKNIELKTENGVTQFTATVENNSGKDYEGGSVTIIFMNEDGTELGRTTTELPSIANGKSNTINSGTTEDFANAYDLKIE